MTVERRMTWKGAGRWAFAALFVVAGVGPFAAPGFYVKLIPPYLPAPLTLVLVSGVFEVALGALLVVPRYSRVAAWGLIALLLAVFPANIHVYRHQEMFHLPPVVHLLRLPLQAVLILWAYAYTKP